MHSPFWHLNSLRLHRPGSTVMKIAIEQGSSYWESTVLCGDGLHGLVHNKTTEVRGNKDAGDASGRYCFKQELS